MSKSKELLAEDTVIVWNGISVGEYRNFFEHAISKDFGRSVGNLDFQTWLFKQAGKTLKEAVVVKPSSRPISHLGKIYYTANNKP